MRSRRRRATSPSASNARRIFSIVRNDADASHGPKTWLISRAGSPGADKVVRYPLPQVCRTPIQIAASGGVPFAALS
jgi:hypothetical protein